MADLLTELAAHGHADVGSLSQAQLLAAGITAVLGTVEERRVVETSFERLDAEDQQLAIERARRVGADTELLALAAGVMTGRAATGSWLMTPPSFGSVEQATLVRIFGMALPDGSNGLLTATVEPSTSRLVLTVRTVVDLAASLAGQIFAADPMSPPGRAQGWTDQYGGGLGELAVTWPWRRGARSITWRITRTSSAASDAVLVMRRDFGVRRSTSVVIDSAELTSRLQLMLTTAATAGGRRPDEPAPRRIGRRRRG